ncbi:aminoglycoside phosphotransferase [Ferrimonas balearica DSM 9799]|uniref:Stress response kinase A n=1 Tax=Ferrimonas balearica (strain DSM 9799 / CCM 4581 / KCTC 23876 / PAT) TaxID=550540 RepID=E1SQ93_FERBD|nr:serine/threonine protein kinase [Ferrimonas balearica]ADN77864.1 aminoglycoside phosphotransferase [Ferrimonas balearica DSM 9799]MBW3166395.1 serine/threonine protein kinase [Ferrimonas balearica]MBY5982198.1 serine/threonine protein kinase [Ferrimonas balearica]MBY6096650.1 serine/threonine protein kinase [Ferrimonas balearica]MBY6108483.1 serine/threonine protein kinase [Ferrimonas balearica]
MSEARFDFHSLTPDRVLDAVESLGVYPDTGLLPLNSYENRVYQFRAEDGRRYVTKFYRPQRWSEAQIREEHQFAQELMESEVPVAAPIAIDGETLFEHDGYRFALWHSVGGRQFEVDNLDQLEAVGRFLGRLHQVGRRQPFQHRPALSVAEFGFEAREVLQQQAELGPHIETPFFTVLDQVLARIEAPLAESMTQLRLHGDMHPGNILWVDEGPSFVDLDDARTGPAIQDLWMMLNGDRASQLLQLDVLLEGYETFASLDSRELKWIEPLRALRMINYLAWLTKRWSDPAFPRNFPWFGTDKFWEQQVLALKEQLAALDEPPLSLTPDYTP